VGSTAETNEQIAGCGDFAAKARGAQENSDIAAISAAVGVQPITSGEKTAKGLKGRRCNIKFCYIFS
jgi:hypothetical protein